MTTPPTYRIRARAKDLDITACTPVLMGCMQRFVISKDVAALREFHQLGIPLDYALDYAVQKGNMPLIEELLNNLGVAPSDTTLQRAMKRGLTIRNMFLERVQPTVRHLNSAVHAEHFDIAHVLLDRNIQPDVQTVVTVKVSPRQSHERKQFVDRLIGSLDLRHLRHMPTLRKLPLITSVAQFERGLDRLVECTEQEREILLIECLRASALGHATAMIHRGAQFRADHMEIAGEGFVQPSDSNPRGLWEVRCAVVLEMAIEHGCLFQAAEDANFLARPLVEKFAFNAPAQFMQQCELVALACRSDVRPRVGQYLMTEAGNKQRRTRATYTLDDLNNLIDAMRETFLRDPARAPQCDVGGPSL